MFCRDLLRVILHMNLVEEGNEEDGETPYDSPTISYNTYTTEYKGFGEPKAPGERENCSANSAYRKEINCENTNILTAF